jgi:hypothetical protein
MLLMATDPLTGMAVRLAEVARRIRTAGRRWQDQVDDEATLALFCSALADLVEIRTELLETDHARGVQTADVIEQLAANLTVALGWVQTAKGTPALPTDLANGVARLRDVVDRLNLLAGHQADLEHRGDR